MRQFWWGPRLSIRQQAGPSQWLSRPHNNYDERSVHTDKPAIWHFIPLDALAANIPWIHSGMFEALWLAVTGCDWPLLSPPLSVGD